MQELFLRLARRFVRRTMARFLCWRKLVEGGLPRPRASWCSRWAVIRDVNSTAASHGGAISLASSACRGASIDASSSLIEDQSLSRGPVTVAGCERGIDCVTAIT